MFIYHCELFGSLYNTHTVFIQIRQPEYKYGGHVVNYIEVQIVKHIKNQSFMTGEQHGLDMRPLGYFWKQEIAFFYFIFYGLIFYQASTRDDDHVTHQNKI